MSEVAARLGCSTKSVSRYIDRTLATSGSSFPTELSPEEINKQRQLRSEMLLSAMAMVRRHMDEVDADEELAADDKLHASAAGLKALSMATARLAAMNALNAPTKIVEESMRLEVRRIDNKITINFDDSMLNDDGRPVPGLHIGVAPSLLEARALPENASEDG